MRSRCVRGVCSSPASVHKYMGGQVLGRCTQAVGRLENMVGWYHSHPGYGCWLSGIDVSTQAIQQQYQEPFLAIVVDPHRTIAAGKVEIGAFRTYPEVPHHPIHALIAVQECFLHDEAEQ